MKKFTRNLYFIGLLFFTQTILLAQPGSGGDGDGGNEGNDPAPAPINTYLVILALLGLGYAFYKFYTYRKSNLVK